uniref:LRAT domain-containing protein n=1 Tax=Panagrolaimus sp. PS1159 TaxID=55785 RepID=A0AC35GE11_9BILA
MPPLMRRRGDLIEHKKLGYSRWSVYIGNGEVVEVDNDNNHEIIRRPRKFEVSVSWVNNEFDDRVKPLKNDVIVQRALSRVGTNWKDTHPFAIINNLSEHFAKWCRYGTDICNQSPHLSFHDNHASVGLGKVETGLLSLKLPNAYTTAQNNSNSTNFKVGAELVGGEAFGAVKWSAQAAADAGIDHGNGKHAINIGVDGPQAQVGPLECKSGIRADTGINCNKNGLGFTILGTGIQIGRKTKVSVLGSSVGINF